MRPTVMISIKAVISCLLMSAAVAQGVNPFGKLQDGVYREDCGDRTDSVFIIEEQGRKVGGIDASCEFQSSLDTLVKLTCTDEDGGSYPTSYRMKVKSATSFSVWMDGYDPYQYKLCIGE